MPCLKNDFEGDLEWRVSVFKSPWIPETPSHYGISPCAWEVPLLLRWKFVVGGPEYLLGFWYWGRGIGLKGAIKQHWFLGSFGFMDKEAFGPCPLKNFFVNPGFFFFY